eukprot:TRINITY_DN25472_c0_g2_i3.p2 TRINITY_DN25472_c0_g2~~TRINITY_DN25472_c0_g2_i3.p2  ORF type:complete len:128 (+),score=3.79 TRINITY_DN25472_c0_g2_i3:271-654(+)
MLHVVVELGLLDQFFLLVFGWGVMFEIIRIVSQSRIARMWKIRFITFNIKLCLKLQELQVSRELLGCGKLDLSHRKLDLLHQVNIKLCLKLQELQVSRELLGCRKLDLLHQVNIKLCLKLQQLQVQL